MPTHRRRRGSRLWSIAWLIALLASIALLSGVSAGVVSAEDPPPVSEEPSPEVSEEPTDTPPPEIPCPGAGDAGFLPPGSQSISGTVTDELDNPIPDVQVRLSQASGIGLATTVTAPTGEYQFEFLGDAIYVVSFYDSSGTFGSGFYNGTDPIVQTRETAAQIPLTGGGAPGIDASLPEETSSTISGVVTDSEGAPVAGAEVTATGRYFPGLVSCATTGGDGTYQITNVRGGVYNVRATASGFPQADYGSPVGVPPDAAAIDFQFPPVYTLSGVVLDDGGSPVDNMQITACPVGGTGSCGFGSSVGGSGGFEVPGLVAGSYNVYEQDGSGFGLYLSGYYGGNGVFQASIDDAEAVDIPPTGPIQLLALPAPQVNGTITNSNGFPVEGLTLSLCDVPDQFNCFGGVTDASGYWAAGTPVSGTYTAFVSDPSGNYPGGYITDLGTLSPAPEDASEIVVTGATITGVDATLPDGGKIEVTLVSGGNPVPFAVVEFCLREFICGEGGNTDEFGLLLSPAVYPGVYYVKAHNDSFTAEYWYVLGAVGSVGFASATPVDVAAGWIESITVEIPGAGTPTDADDGVAPVEVQLGDGTGNTPVTMTFDDVTVSGTTSLTVSEAPAPVPDGFQVGVPATYYDINTTAEFDGSILVCISYAGVSFIDPGNVHLFHFESSGWIDITQPPVDTVNQIVCGLTDSLSPFVLAERSYAFSGFFGPKSPPKLNDAKAGDAIGVQFGLGGDFGLSVFAEGSPVLQHIDCSTGTAIGDPDATTASLKYSARTDRYTFQFKTQKAWKNTCREISLTFKDGTPAALWYCLKP